MKKSVILFALLVAFSAQKASAQSLPDSNITPCPEPQAVNDGSFCPTPTPTPVPSPTPTPTPAPRGMVGPKFAVLTVTYAPPGSSSSVAYLNSTMLGNSTSVNNSFLFDTKISATLTAGADVLGVGSEVTGTASLDIQQQTDNSSSIAVNETTNVGTTVRGPSSSAVGIDHEEDIVWIWLNPLLSFTLNSDTDFQWNGFYFDMRDPAGDVDIVGIPVKYLNGHVAIPANLAAVLARTWAPRVVCASTDPECGADGTKGPGLTAADLAEILKADPFADPQYIVNVPTGSACTLDGRFCRLTNQTLLYLPAPPGGQPITQTYSLVHQTTSTEGQGVTDQTKTGFSWGASTTIGDGFLAKFKLKLSQDLTWTWTHKWNSNSTNQVGQTATATITGPTANDNYTGPVQLNVFQDNLYGTFMFNFIIEPTFALSVSPSSQSVFQGACTTYNVSISALVSGFAGTINLSVSGLPANSTGTFSPATISGAGPSLLTVCTTPGTPIGSQTLMVVGSYGPEVHTAPVTLAVNPAPDFALTASPTSKSVSQGSTASFVISAASISGYSGNVALSVSGLPAGSTAIWSPANIAVGGSSVLYVSTSSATPLGAYSLVVIGVSGSKTHSVGLTLGVTSPPPPPSGCTIPSPTCRVQN